MLCSTEINYTCDEKIYRTVYSSIDHRELFPFPTHPTTNEKLKKKLIQMLCFVLLLTDLKVVAFQLIDNDRGCQQYITSNWHQPTVQYAFIFGGLANYWELPACIRVDCKQFSRLAGVTIDVCIFFFWCHHAFLLYTSTVIICCTPFLASCAFSVLMC